MNFKEERQYKINQIEKIIEKYMPEEAGYQKSVIQAMNYAILAGGKRLRPMLMEETYRLFGGDDRKMIEPFIAAIEMIHTYSLVHDDLPAMDNDDYRRGRKTTHVVFGEGMAILAGDALLNYAFEVAGKVYKNINIDNTNALQMYQRVAKANEILAIKAGVNGMLGGQVVDIENYNGSLERERLDFIYHLKTGALFEASMMIGAVLAGASSNEIDRIEMIASDIGLAFQIKDDILDITSSAEVLGKPVLSDEKNDKSTYVSLMSIEQANAEVTRISERAMMSFHQLPYENEYLKALIINLITREN